MRLQARDGREREGDGGGMGRRGEMEEERGEREEGEREREGVGRMGERCIWFYSHLLYSFRFTCTVVIRMFDIPHVDREALVVGCFCFVYVRWLCMSRRETDHVEVWPKGDGRMCGVGEEEGVGSSANVFPHQHHKSTPLVLSAKTLGEEEGGEGRDASARPRNYLRVLHGHWDLFRYILRCRRSDPKFQSETVEVFVCWRSRDWPPTNKHWRRRIAKTGVRGLWSAFVSRCSSLVQVERTVFSKSVASTVAPRRRHQATR